MNILEAFERLDIINEAYSGSYQSNYLNLSDAEREAAKQEYKDKRDYPRMITASGAVKPGRLDGSSEKFYIIDFDAFHRGYDKDLAEVGLLSMFDADGKLTVYGSYGNIKEAEAAGHKQKPGYKAAKELWSWVFADSVWQNGRQLDLKSRRHQIIDADVATQKVANRKKQELAAAEAKKQLQAKIAKDKADAETLEQTALQAASDAYDVLVDSLDLAIDNIDPALLADLVDFSGDEPSLELHGKTIILNVPGLNRIPIPVSDASKYDAKTLEDLINSELTNLDEKKIERDIGLEYVKEVRASIGKDKWLIAYFADAVTGATYANYENALGLESISRTQGVAKLQNCTNCLLALIVIKGADSRNSNRTTQDKIYYAGYSYNEATTQDLQEIIKKLPVEKTDPMLSNVLDWYDETNISSAPEYQREYFAIGEDFDFDTWCYEKETQTATN